MNRLLLNQTGGFPLSTNILDAMQSAYSLFNALGNLGGNFSIISGCYESGSSVSDGVVFVNGEVFEFRGNIVSPNVTIGTETENRNFEVGGSKTVIVRRFMTFGTSTPENTFAWSEFKRIFPTNAIQLFKNDHEARLAALEAKPNPIPIGLVAIWGKPADQIPSGWVEHTELQGRVPVGHKPGDLNFGSLDNTVGAAQITLDITQIPPHTHSVNAYLATENKVPNTGSGQNGFNQTLATSSAGGGQPHSNIQPSRIVKFIRFVGFNINN